MKGSAVATGFLFLLGGWGVVAAVEVRDLERAQQLTDRGAAATEDGQLPEARGLYEKALKAVAGFPEARLGLGQVAMAEKDFDLALVQFEQAREGYAKLGDLLWDLDNRRYLEAKRTTELLRQEISQLDSPELNLSESDRRTRKQSLEQRIRDLETMGPPNRTSAAAVPARVDFLVGNALSRLKNWDEAIAAYRAALEKDPQFAAAHHNAALAYWRAGQVDTAMQSLDRAAELGYEVQPQLKADLQLALERQRASGEAR